MNHNNVLFRKLVFVSTPSIAYFTTIQSIFMHTSIADLFPGTMFHCHAILLALAMSVGISVFRSLKLFKLVMKKTIQGVPKHWAHFDFVIFSGSRAHTEEFFIAIG